MEEEIPLEDLVVGDRVIALQLGVPGKTSFKGVVSEIIRHPPYRFRGKRVEEVTVWLDTGRGAARDIGLNLTVGAEVPQWVFLEDPAATTKRNARSLAEISAMARPLLPHDVVGKIADYTGLKKTAKKKGGRRRKTRKSRT